MKMKQTTRSGLPLISLERAVELMRNSEPVIFPTETFFALGSRALDSNASARVFRAKRRSTVRPLPLIIGNWEQLDQVTKKIDASIRPLLETFWPGPLSVIFPAPLRVPDILTGGTGRVAVRLSPHPVAAQLAAELGEPVTASSANISGTPAVTQAELLDPELFPNIGGILDLPPAPGGGLPSTLVEPDTTGRLVILREGAISRTQLISAGFAIADSAV